MVNISYILFAFVCIVVCANCDLSTQARIAPTSKRNINWDKEQTIALLKHDLLIEIGSSIVDRSVVETIPSELDPKVDYQFLVKLKGPITDALKESIENSISVKFSYYIPYNTFMIQINSSIARKLQNTDGVLWVGLYHPEFKISPELSVNLQARGISSGSLIVSLVPNLSMEQAEAISSNIRELLAPIDATLVIKARSPRRLEISWKTPATLAQVITLVSQVPQVEWLEPKQEIKPQNLFARVVLQGGNFNGETLPVWNTNELGTTPYHDVGLRGENQIIGVGDTGLDYKNCYFYDSNEDVAINSVNQAHRKVVAYFYNTTDAIDITYGHGTHVCGTVAGEAVTTVNGTVAHNGVAYKAKIAFFDLVTTGQTAFDLPVELGQYFQPFQDVGCHIVSNSWGGGTLYDSITRDVDEFTWNNPYLLPVFAAGNSGTTGLKSVASPSNSKNCLSVGSNNNAFESWKYTSLAFDMVITASTNSFPAWLGQFSPISYKSASVTGKTIRPSSPLACDPFPAASMTGKIALLDRGTCEFFTKVKNAQDAGAIAVIIINTNDTLMRMGFGTANNFYEINVFAMLVTNSSGEVLKAYTEDITITPSTETSTPTNAQNINILSDFSSLGPTIDGRFKPDITGPGSYVLSARSHGGNKTNAVCGTTDVMYNQGTSMATPAVSATAALVRQYFTEGFYPTGERVNENSFSPKSSLLKATLIHSGVSLTHRDTGDAGNGIFSFANMSIPSVYQGYGRVSLDKVLVLKDKSTFNLWVNDNATLSSLDTDVYCFTVRNTSNVPFRVTLVWNDYPSSTASKINLVNNLDLLVQTETGESFYGNNLYVQDGSVKRKAFDELNNVEQVTITDNGDEGIEYSISILGTQIPKGPQPYSLVVTGDITYSPSGCSTTCPNDCSQKGTCVSGKCTCQTTYTGLDCSIGSTPITGTATGFGTPRLWTYYRYQAPLNTTDNLKVMLISKSGDPDLYIGVNEFPTFTKFNYSQTTCDNCDSYQNRNGVAIPNNALVPGATYYIGVYTNCCDNSDYTVSAELTNESCIYNCDTVSGASGINIKVWMVILFAMVVMFLSI